MGGRWWTLVAVSLATFMTNLDNNVINVAIPTIQRSLHLSVAGLEWVVGSYLLVFAGLLLAGGRIADVYGRRRFFLIGLTTFTLASLGAGLAGSGSVLIGGRLVQGLGAALVAPTTLSIILATFDDARERIAAVGTCTAIVAMALAFGPLIGGYISQHLRWGWIFFINVPVGVVTFVIALLAMRESRNLPARRRLDLPGLITSSIALTALTWALIEGHDKGWTSGAIGAAFAVAAAAGLAFGMIETRAAHPMVDLRLFRSPVLSGGTFTLMLWAFGIFGIYFFTSIYLQDILGFSPVKAGLAFVPMALCLALFAAIAGLVSRVMRPHQTVALGMAVMATGLYLVSRLGGATTFAGLMPGFLMFGAGAGLMDVPLTNAVLRSMPRDRSGVASALLNTSREVAGLLGIAVIGAILRARQSAAASTGASLARSYLDGFHAGLLVTVILVVSGAVVSYLTLRGAGGQEPTAEQVKAAAIDKVAPAPALAAGGAAAAAPAGEPPPRRGGTSAEQAAGHDPGLRGLQDPAIGEGQAQQRTRRRSQRGGQHR